MKGYEGLFFNKANVEIGRRKWDGQWFIQINNKFVKIDERTYNRMIKQFASSKLNEEGKK